MRRFSRHLSGFLLAAVFLPSGSAFANDSISPLAVEVEAYQAINQRLQDVGWKLAAGNARYCTSTRPASGLQLQDMASYGDPAMMRQMFELDGDFAVLSIAKGSPAGRSGLVPNDEIVAIDGAMLSAWPANERLDWQREKRMHDALDAALARDGRVAIGLRGGDAVTITGIVTCTSRFELAGKGSRAVADGERVQIGSSFVGIAYPEEEFAAAIAHELAHNILGHRKWLDTNGRKRRQVRATEREADRLMPWLLANAGYDPEAAVRFMERWGPANDGGIFRKRTHDGWDERVDLIRAELEAIEGTRAEDGSADWATHFRRDLDSKAPA